MTGLSYFMLNRSKIGAMFFIKQTMSGVNIRDLNPLSHVHRILKYTVGSKQGTL